jgi:hypothetical protein
LAAQDLREATVELVARPYSQFDPANTIWWLIPSTDWPAYRFAKLFFLADRGAPILFSGIYIEKGLARAVAEAYHRRPAFAMDNSWAWHRFNEDLRGGVVSTAVAEIAERSEIPVRVQVQASVSIARESSQFEPHDDTTFEHPADVIEYETVDGGLRVVGRKGPGRIVDPLVDVDDLTDLPDAVSSLSQLDWTWINVLIGIPMSMPTEPREDRSSVSIASDWDANAVWKNGLRSWGRWVRR